MLNFYLLKPFFQDKLEKKIVYFISKAFPKEKYYNDKIILIENNINKIHHISYLYLLLSLVKKYKCQVHIYDISQLMSIKRIIYNFITKLRKPFFFSYLNSIFETKIVSNNSFFDDESAERIFKSKIKKIKKKSDFYKLKIFNIHFGDILYDHYLKKFRVPTIDISNEHFKKFLRSSIQNIIFWNNFFIKNKIKSVIVSHATYWAGITARISMHNKIPVYMSDINNTFLLTNKNKFAYKKFLNYKKNFNKFSKSEKKKFKKQADQRLQLRMSGRVGVDMSYSTTSGWTSTKSKKNALSSNKKIKILICAHCFFDSPNGMGKNLFVDFYEWIKFLGKLSFETDYDWYIKTHPDVLPGNFEIIQEVSKSFKNIKILPSNTSHHNIISNGIDFVLTVYGTVGIEYSYKKIPVINASTNNPNINYNYNFHPKSIKQYKYMIKNLKKLNIKINKQEILESYFMNYLNCDNNIYFANTEKFNKKFTWKILHYFVSSDIYNYWINNFDNSQHKSIIKKIDKFLISKNYYLQK